MGSLSCRWAHDLKAHVHIKSNWINTCLTVSRQYFPFVAKAFNTLSWCIFVPQIWKFFHFILKLLSIRLISWVHFSLWQNTIQLSVKLEQLKLILKLIRLSPWSPQMVLRVFCLNFTETGMVIVLFSTKYETILFIYFLSSKLHTLDLKAYVLFQLKTSSLRIDFDLSHMIDNQDTVK